MDEVKNMLKNIGFKSLTNTSESLKKKNKTGIFVVFVVRKW
jgi:hypothetical protein